MYWILKWTIATKKVHQDDSLFRQNTYEPVLWIKIQSGFLIARSGITRYCIQHCKKMNIIRSDLELKKWYPELALKYEMSVMGIFNHIGPCYDDTVLWYITCTIFDEKCIRWWHAIKLKLKWLSEILECIDWINDIQNFPSKLALIMT